MKSFGLDSELRRKLIAASCLIFMGIGSLIFFSNTKQQDPARSMPQIHGAAVDTSQGTLLSKSNTSSPVPQKDKAAQTKATKPSEPASRESNADVSILDPSVEADQRRELLAQLTLQGRQAIPALVRIARAPLPNANVAPAPHSIEEMQTRFERGIRITALEALDQLGTQNADLGKALEEVATTQSDPIVKFLAGVSWAGLQQGRPGKLTRFIDATLNQ